MFPGLLLLFIFGFNREVTSAVVVPSKSYTCSAETNSCVLNPRGSEGLSHGTCLMLCGRGNLWPYPTGTVRVDSQYSPIQKITEAAVKGLDAIEEMLLALLNEGISSFVETVSMHSVGEAQPKSRLLDSKEIFISLEIKDQTIVQASIDNDESYVLDVATDDAASSVLVSITAPSYFGVRHGLETLSQLVVWDHFAESYVISNSVHIEDAPTFPYRGVLVDTSRHFISMEKLRETIRAMGYNKMNVLHWHLSDTASFPAEMQRQPNITSYGAYSSSDVYSTSDLEALASYANARGVMVLPEIDAPAHMEAGWQWGPDAGLGELTLCGAPLGDDGTSWAGDSLEPPSGQLNLANEHVYGILSDVYRDVVDVFGGAGFFHMGGDEVIVGSDDASVACYNSSTLGQPVLALLDKLGLSRQDSSSFYFLWEEFTKRAARLIRNAFGTDSNDFSFKKVHIWGGGAEGDKVCYNLMSQPNLQSVLPPSQVTIQVWDESSDSITKSLIQQGYDVILSNYDYVYLDCGNAGFTNPGGYWCQPYHEWYHLYQYVRDAQSKWDLSEEDMNKVLGSEALLWAEMVDDSNLAQKLWPRSAALAEALWTHTKAPQLPRPAAAGGGAGEVTTVPAWYAAEPRMQHWRNTMVARGIPAEALQPLWCQQRSDHVCTLNMGVPQ